jgi:hypothetical protein
MRIIDSRNKIIIKSSNIGNIEMTNEIKYRQVKFQTKIIAY